MKTYQVNDESLRSVHVGENAFYVEDGQIELPVEVAQEFIGSGQISLLPKADQPTASQMTPEQIAKFAKEAKKAKAELDKANRAAAKAKNAGQDNGETSDEGE